MTKAELIEYAKRRLAAGEADPRIWPENEIEIAAAVGTALHRLANDVMHDPLLRAYFQDTYSLALNASGEGVLSAATSVGSVDSVLLYESVWDGPVFDNDGRQLWPLRQYADFTRPQPTHRGYFHLKNGKMLTRAMGMNVNGPADIYGVSTPVSFTGSYAPNDVGDVSAELDDQLIDTLVAVVLQNAAKKQ